MTQAKASSRQGRRRLIARCRTRPVSHVASEMNISRATASIWVSRYLRYGDLGLLGGASTPYHQPTATPPYKAARIEDMRRTPKWSASCIAFKLQADGATTSLSTAARRLEKLGLNRRRFIDSNGESKRAPHTITARRPGHMVRIYVKSRPHPRRRPLARPRSQNRQSKER